MALDLLWSDPASTEMEELGWLDPSGFGASPRGEFATAFGHTAVDNFLRVNDLSYIVRAHEAHSDGVQLSKAARVFTVFSTSKDHNQGKKSMAGCILVDQDKIQVKKIQGFKIKCIFPHDIPYYFFAILFCFILFSLYR